MTTQTNPSSPFQNTNTQEKTVASDFSIRTMKDDLLMLQKNEALISEKMKAPKIDVPKETVPVPFEKIETPKTEPLPEKTITPDSNPFMEKKSAVTPASIQGQEMKESSFSAPFKEQEETILVEIPITEKKSTPSSNATYKIVLTFIAILILAIFGLGGYYFWLTNQTAEPEMVVAVVTEEPVIQEEVPVVIAPTEKYSQSKPNYLTVDFASTTDIQGSLGSIITELKEKGDKSAYEFILVDNNNDPIAFSIFATAAKLALSPKLLGALDRNFSLFIYNDSEVQHLAIAIGVQKKDLVALEALKHEKTFVKDASLLFLDATPEIKSGQFKSGTYNGLSTRYLNLNKEETLSIDYTITDSQMIIGTSKNTLRAVIDKVITTTNSDVPAKNN